MNTVRRLEFGHPGTIIDAAGFVQSRLLSLLCETHQALTFYQVPSGLPGRYHVTVETCCAAALAQAAEALTTDIPRSSDPRIAAAAGGSGGRR